MQNNSIIKESCSIKTIISCVLQNGLKSPYINYFIKICRDEARYHIIRSKFRDFLIQKTGCSVDDLAIDLIADLFETRDDRFFYIGKYFQDKAEKIKDFSDDELLQMIRKLIRSSANQRISEIRQDFGEVYFLVKKAIEILLTRKCNIYKKIFVNDVQFIYRCNYDNLNLDKDEMTEDELVRKVFLYPYKTYQIPEVVHNVFEVLDSEEDVCRTVEKQKLFNTVTSFYKHRLDAATKLKEDSSSFSFSY